MAYVTPGPGGFRPPRTLVVPRPPIRPDHPLALAAAIHALGGGAVTNANDFGTPGPLGPLKPLSAPGTPPPPLAPETAFLGLGTPATPSVPGAPPALPAQPGTVASLPSTAPPPPAAPPSPFASLAGTTDAQLTEQAKSYIDALNSPLIKQITDAINARAASGQAAITGYTGSLAGTLGGVGPAIQAAYSQAAGQQASTDAALRSVLTGQGQSQADSLAARLAAAGQDTTPGTNLAALGTGAGNAQYAQGSSALAALLAHGAAGGEYGAKLPGIAALGGLQASKGLQAQGAAELATKLGEVSARVPGQIQSELSALQGRRLTAQVAQSNAATAAANRAANQKIAADRLAAAQAGADRRTAAAQAGADRRTAAAQAGTDRRAVAAEKVRIAIANQQAAIHSGDAAAKVKAAKLVADATADQRMFDRADKKSRSTGYQWDVKPDGSGIYQKTDASGQPIPTEKERLRQAALDAKENKIDLSLSRSLGKYVYVGGKEVPELKGQKPPPFFKPASPGASKVGLPNPGVSRLYNDGFAHDVIGTVVIGKDGTPQRIPRTAVKSPGEAQAKAGQAAIVRANALAITVAREGIKRVGTFKLQPKTDPFGGIIKGPNGKPLLQRTRVGDRLATDYGTTILRIEAAIAPVLSPYMSHDDIIRFAQQHANVYFKPGQGGRPGTGTTPAALAAANKAPSGDVTKSPIYRGPAPPPLPDVPGVLRPPFQGASYAQKATPSPQLSSMIEQAARAYNIDPRVFSALVNQESQGNQDARSPRGAIGLAQLTPDTARSLGVDPYDARQNLLGGARYLREQLDKFGSLALALAAYNAGPGAVQKYGGIPPYAETQDYVRKILAAVNSGTL